MKIQDHQNQFSQSTEYEDLFRREVIQSIQTFCAKAPKQDESACVLISIDNLIVLEYLEELDFIEYLRHIVRLTLNDDALLQRISYNCFLLLLSDSTRESILGNINYIHGHLSQIFNQNSKLGYGILPKIRIGQELIQHQDDFYVLMHRLHLSMQKSQRNFSLEAEDGNPQSTEFFENVKLIKHLQHNILTGDIKLAFQGIVDTKSMTSVFYEGFLRVKNSGGKFISAAQYINAAEEFGTIGRVDIEVLKMGIYELYINQNLQLNINVSPITIQDGEWEKVAFQLLNTKSSIAKRLTVEITETAAMDTNNFLRFMSNMKKLGCNTALDDFGSGNTSISQLRIMAGLTFLKIDGNLVLDSIKDPRAFAIVKGIVHLSRELGIKTIAESVESAEISNLMKNIGVDFLQGYHLSVPH